MVTKVIGSKNLRGLILYNETKVSQEEAKCLSETGFGADSGKLSAAQKLRRLSRPRPTIRSRDAFVSDLPIEFYGKHR